MYRFNFKNYQPMNLITKTAQGNQLWLGDYQAATNINLLKQNKIKHVLTVAAMLNISYPKQVSINHKVIHAFDLPTYKMTPHFDQAYQFIHRGLENGNVLVHCAAGISRSTTCVLIYLMRKKKLNFKQSLEIVRKKRAIVNPNYGFQNELIQFEKTLKDYTESQDEKKYSKQAQEQKNAVLNFIKEQNNSKKLNSTIAGKTQTHLLPKTEEQLVNARGKSQNFRNTFQIPTNKQQRLTDKFLTFNLQPPKIVTIKK